MTRSISSRRDAGFTLLELMIALVILSFVMGSAISLLRSQNLYFARGTRRTDMLQNGRFAVGNVERVLRTMGSGVTGQQPMLAYAGTDVIAFNTDYTETDTTLSRWAVNFNPDVPAADGVAWDAAAAATLPNTGFSYPSQTYRLRNGASSPAETVIFFLRADASTARSDDFELMQQVNNGAAETVAHDLLAYPGRPFFEYFIRRTPANLTQATGAEVPLIRRSLTTAVTAADTAAALRPDSVGFVRFNVRVTNGLTTAEQRTADISTGIELPNNGLPQPTVCGRAPLPPATLTMAYGAAGTGQVTLIWTPSPDQGSGELDVRQYIVYQRDDTATVWREPLFNVRADTNTVYTAQVGGLTPTSLYDFGVVAQDCTPASSSFTARMGETAP